MKRFGPPQHYITTVNGEAWAGWWLPRGCHCPARYFPVFGKEKSAAGEATALSSDSGGSQNNLPLQPQNSRFIPAHQKKNYFRPTSCGIYSFWPVPCDFITR